jgi:hypothetical protein
LEEYLELESPWSRLRKVDDSKLFVFIIAKHIPDQKDIVVKVQDEVDEGLLFGFGIKICSLVL